MDYRLSNNQSRQKLIDARLGSVDRYQASRSCRSGVMTPKYRPLPGRRERQLPPLIRRPEIPLTQRPVEISGPDYSELPLEIQQNILLNLPYDDIINYCRVNRTAAGICDDVYFWKRKARLEGYPDLLIDDTNPSRRYKELQDYGECLITPTIRCFEDALKRNDLAVVNYMVDKNVDWHVSLSILPTLLDNDLTDLARKVLPQIRTGFLGHGVNMNRWDRQNEEYLGSLRVALNIAADKGIYDIIIYILTEIMNKPGIEALPYVAKSNDLALVQRLVNEFGVDVPFFNYTITNTISRMNSANDKTKYRQILNYLFRHHPDINSIANDIARASPDLTTLNDLINSGFDSYGELLFSALDYNRIDIVDRLLDDPDIQITDENREAALGIAVYMENLDMIKRLVRDNATLLNKALEYYIIQAHVSIDIAKYLISKGGDINEALYELIDRFHTLGNVTSLIDKAVRTGADLMTVRDIANENNNLIVSRLLDQFI